MTLRSRPASTGPAIVTRRASPRFPAVCQVLLIGGFAALVALRGVNATAGDKTLRVAVAFGEMSFDPAFAYDVVSSLVIDSIMEPMLDYDYLARPMKLVPRTLAAMPTVEDGGLTYVCKIRPGILFAPDSAFKGKPRELTASDHAYALKRILDPALKSPWLWMLEGKIVGADEARAHAAKSGRFDYDAPLPGLEVVDRYTLKIRLRTPDLRFPYVLAVGHTAAMAREAVEAYGSDIGAHPVGTGPYMLGQYRRSARFELVKNPTFRDMTYVPEGSVAADQLPIAAALKGKHLPLVPRVEISVMEEGQARWLAFMNGEIDLLLPLPLQFVDQALAHGKLKPELASKGVIHQPVVLPSVAYTRFDVGNATIGGYSPEKVALRRAISMAFNIDEAVRVLYHGRAVPAQGPVPPDVAGYEPGLRTGAQTYDPALARRLLDRYGYRMQSDGYRDTPDGKPLVIESWSNPSTLARDRDELWKKSLDAIGVRLMIRKDKTPEIAKMARNGQVPMSDEGWLADYPDAENFMQLLYGPNSGQANTSRFNLPEFNRMFDEAQRLPDSPDRNALFAKMADLIAVYAPWRVMVNPITDTLAQRWVKHFVPHPIRFPGELAYIDVDEASRGHLKSAVDGACGNGKTCRPDLTPPATGGMIVSRTSGATTGSGR